jgi:acid phosphatase type 7
MQRLTDLFISDTLRHVILSGFIVCASSVAMPQATAAEAVALTRGPYLQNGTSTTMNVVWRTRTAITPTLKFGTAPDTLTTSVAATDITIRRTQEDGGGENGGLPLSGAPQGTFQFNATIKNLQPDTKYYYGVFDGERQISPADATYYFRTLPPPGPAARPLLFWVVGDSGTGNRVQSAVHTAMRGFLHAESRSLDGYVHVGDMAYGSGLDSEFQGFFFQPYDETLRNTVCWPTFGNHEGRSAASKTGAGPYFDCYVCPVNGENGGLPSGTESYYSINYGPIHFISLNSFDTARTPDGPMAQWLRADLEKATTAKWIIAFFHHPPYTKGTHDSDKGKELVEMRENIMPILESGGVDLVMNGHSHIYERSMLIDGAYKTPTTADGVVLDDRDGDPRGQGPYRKSDGIHPNRGTIAMVAGHGGTTLGRVKTGPLPIMRTTIVEFGSVLIEVAGDTLTGRMLNHEGVIRDTFALQKQGTVEVARMANPRLPEPLTTPLSIPASQALPTGTDDAARPAPKVYSALIAPKSSWHYLGGSKPQPNWTTDLTVAEGWKTGVVSIGYSDEDDETILTDMRNQYRYLCLRQSFEIKGTEALDQLGLGMRVDDGFICYLNGKEVYRFNVESGSLDTATGISPHEAKPKWRFYPLGKHKDLLKPGTNVIALEIHNDNLDSSDLTADPCLVISSPDAANKESAENSTPKEPSSAD